MLKGTVILFLYIISVFITLPVSCQDSYEVNIFINRDLTATIDMKLSSMMFFFERSKPNWLVPDCVYSGTFNLSMSGDYLVGIYEITIAPETMGNMSLMQVRMFLSSFDELAFFELMKLLYMPEGGLISNINVNIREMNNSVSVRGAADFKLRSIYIKKLKGEFTGYSSRNGLFITYRIEAELENIEETRGGSVIINLEPIIGLIPPNALCSIRLWYPPDMLSVEEVYPSSCLNSYGMIEWFYVFTENNRQYFVRFKLIRSGITLVYTLAPIALVAITALITLKPWKLDRKLTR